MESESEDQDDVIKDPDYTFPQVGTSSESENDKAEMDPSSKDFQIKEHDSTSTSNRNAPERSESDDQDDVIKDPDYTFPQVGTSSEIEKDKAEMDPSSKDFQIKEHDSTSTSNRNAPERSKSDDQDDVIKDPDYTFPQVGTSSESEKDKAEMDPRSKDFQIKEHDSTSTSNRNAPARSESLAITTIASKGTKTLPSSTSTKHLNSKNDKFTKSSKTPVSKTVPVKATLPKSTTTADQSHNKNKRKGGPVLLTTDNEKRRKKSGEKGSNTLAPKRFAPTMVKLRSGVLLKLKRWSDEKRGRHIPRRKQRATKGEFPKRKPRQCPECPLQVQNLPRHLRDAHDVSKDKSKEISYNLKHNTEEHSGKRRRHGCPVAGCKAKIQNVKQHLMQVHAIIGEEATEIASHKLYSSSESDDEIEDQNITDEAISFPIRKIMATSIHEKKMQTDDSNVKTIKKSDPKKAFVQNKDVSSEKQSTATEIPTDTVTATPEMPTRYTYWNEHPVIQRYYQFLVSVDGGKSASVAQTRCENLYRIWSTIDPEMEIASMLDGNRIRDRFVEPKRKSSQPGTVKSYIGVLRDFWAFLRFQDDMGDLLTTLTRLFFQAERWQRTTHQESKQRHVDLMVNESNTRITPEDIKAFMESTPARMAINALNNLPAGNTISASDYRLMRNFLMLCICIFNGQRSGAVRNIDMRRFRNPDRRLTETVLHIPQHKTSLSRGPATLVLNSQVWVWLKLFVKYARSQVLNFNESFTSDDSPVFLTYPQHATDTPGPLTASAFNYAVNSIWNMVHESSITCTKLRKTVTTTVRQVAPGEREALAQQMSHRPSTADQYYVLNQRADDAVRVVRLITSLLTDPENEEQKASFEENSDNQAREQQEPSEQQESSEELREEVPNISHPPQLRDEVPKEKYQTLSSSFLEHPRRAFATEDASLLIRLCEEMITQGGITHVRVLDTLSSTAEGRDLIRCYRSIHGESLPKKLADRLRTERKNRLKRKEQKKK